MKKTLAREQQAPSSTILQLADHLTKQEKAQQCGLAQGGLKYAWPQMVTEVDTRHHIEVDQMGSRRFQFRFVHL